MTVGRPSDKVVETEIEGEISLYQPVTEQVTVLNGTASDIWRLCDGEHTVAEIAKLLASAYEIEDHEQVEQDVRDTIRSFQEAKLLVDS